MFEGNLVPSLVKGVSSGSRLSTGESAFEKEIHRTEEGQHEVDQEMQVDSVAICWLQACPDRKWEAERLENQLPVFPQCLIPECT